METNYDGCGAKLAAAMVKVQAGLKGARKVKENPHLRSRYADLASVWEACYEALTENGVAVIQPFAFEGGVMFLDTILLHESGESIRGRYMLRPVKEDPQAYGSAATYARRYSLAAMIGIVQYDDDALFASRRGRAGSAIDKVKGKDVISAAERIALKKIWTKAGKTESQVASYLQEAFEVGSTAEIQKKDYQEIAAWCAEPKPNAGPAQDKA